VTSARAEIPGRGAIALFPLCVAQELGVDRLVPGEAPADLHVAPVRGRVHGRGLSLPGALAKGAAILQRQVGVHPVGARHLFDVFLPPLGDEFLRPVEDLRDVGPAFPLTAQMDRPEPVLVLLVPSGGVALEVSLELKVAV